MMADVNLDAVQAGLKATRLLRASVRDLVKILSDGPSTPAVDDTDGDKSLSSELTNSISLINSRIRDLETATTLLVHPSCSANINLGNTSLLGHDPAWE